MPIGFILWLIIVFIIYKKKGGRVASIVFLFPFVYMLLLIMYALPIAEVVTFFITINLIGIGASIIWCIILNKIASYDIFIWLGVIPSILVFLTYQWASNGGSLF